MNLPEDNLAADYHFRVEWRDGPQHTSGRFFHSYAQAERFAARNEARLSSEAMQDLAETEKLVRTERHWRALLVRSLRNVTCS
jgi:hypothetical protein